MEVVETKKKMSDSQTSLSILEWNYAGKKKSCFEDNIWEKDFCLASQTPMPWFTSCLYVNFNTEEYLSQILSCDFESECIVSGSEHFLRAITPNIFLRTSIHIKKHHLLSFLSTRETWCLALSKDKITTRHYRSFSIPVNFKKNYTKVLKLLIELSQKPSTQDHHLLFHKWKMLLKKNKLRTKNNSLVFLHEIVQKGNREDLLTVFENLPPLVQQINGKFNNVYDRYVHATSSTINKYVKFCVKRFLHGREKVFVNLDWKFLNFIVHTDCDKLAKTNVFLTDIFPTSNHCFLLEEFEPALKNLFISSARSPRSRSYLVASFLLVSVLNTCREFDKYHQEHSAHACTGKGCKGNHANCKLLNLIQALFTEFLQMAQEIKDNFSDFIDKVLETILLIRLKLPKSKAVKTKNRRTQSVLDTIYYYAVREYYNSQHILSQLFAYLQIVQKSSLVCTDLYDLEKKRKKWLRLACFNILRCPFCSTVPPWTCIFITPNVFEGSKFKKIRLDPLISHPSDSKTSKVQKKKYTPPYKENLSGRDTKKQRVQAAAVQKTIYISLYTLKQNQKKYASLVKDSNEKGICNSPRPRTLPLYPWNLSLQEKRLFKNITDFLKQPSRNTHRAQSQT